MVEFNIKGKEKQEIAAKFFQRLLYILEKEKVEADKKVLVELRSCDFIVEAATENKEVKFKLFQECDKLIKKEAILVSNTSSISITLILLEGLTATVIMTGARRGFFLSTSSLT